MNVFIFVRKGLSGLKDALDCQQRILGVAQISVELNNVERNELVIIECGCYYLANLLRLKAIGHSSSRAVDKLGVENINIETNVYRPCQLLNIVDDTWHVEHSDFLISNGFAFKIVDIADANVSQVFKLEFAEVHAARPMHFLHTQADGERSAVRVS